MERVLRTLEIDGNTVDVVEMVDKVRATDAATLGEIVRTPGPGGVAGEPAGW